MGTATAITSGIRIHNNNYIITIIMRRSTRKTKLLETSELAAFTYDGDDLDFKEVFFLNMIFVCVKILFYKKGIRSMLSAHLRQLNCIKL